MSVQSAAFNVVLGLLLASPALAVPAFVPERLVVQERIRPGANLFVVDSNWAGASAITVLSAEDLRVQGNLSVGLTAQFTLSADGRTLYAASAYARRIVYGETEAVLQEFDVETLSLRREIPISPKFAQAAPSRNAVQRSAAGRYVYVQNATPASSVSVVDLIAGKQVAEVPTPGCWGIYPAAEEGRFSSLCGDGTLTSYQVTDEGRLMRPVKSERIFDADAEPLFLQGVRAGEDLLFVSYHGDLYRVSDAQSVIRLKDRTSFVQGMDGWAPGGFQLMAYSPVHDLLFVAMHEDARDGSHKDPSKQVWALRADSGERLARYDIEGAVALVASPTDLPTLMAIGEEGDLTRYRIDPQQGFAAIPAGKADALGSFTPMMYWGE